jgi:hypothetical protein
MNMIEYTAKTQGHVLYSSLVDRYVLTRKAERAKALLQQRPISGVSGSLGLNAEVGRITYSSSTITNVIR